MGPPSRLRFSKGSMCVLGQRAELYCPLSCLALHPWFLMKMTRDGMGWDDSNVACFSLPAGLCVDETDETKGNDNAKGWARQGPVT